MNIFIAIITLCLAALSYGLYFRDVFRGHTRPHGVTWAIWAGLNGFIFVQQLVNGAGPGAWVTGIAAIANLCIFILSFRYGERNITRFDWLCLGLVGVAFSYWVFTADITGTIISAVVIFILGLLPTIRKSYRHASEETATTFALNGIKFLLAFFALDVVSFVTGVYPLTLFVANLGFAVYLVFLRKFVKQTKRTKRRA